MKKSGILVLVFVFALISGFIAQAADTAGETSSLNEARKVMGNKAERGTMNVLFGWTELPKSIVDVTKEAKNPFWGILKGGYEGLVTAVARTTSGVVDIVTCAYKPDQAPMIDYTTVLDKKK